MTPNASRITIVGTGLIGGSIGLALRRSGRAVVTGVDATVANAEAARSAGAIDEVASDIASAVSEADIVVVATPVGEILSTIAAVAGSAKDGAVVTDVGSTKRTIVAEAERLLGPRRAFVGGHPMAGTEGEGIASAREDLFDGALWILTPTEHTDSAAYRTTNALVSSLGARTLAMEPDEHDRLVAVVSHLPYALATALMVLAARQDDQRLFAAAAGSFRDVTRTAGSNPRVWRDIFSTNREALVEELDGFAGLLRSIRDAVADDRWEEFDSLVSQARDARRRFPVKGDRTVTEPVIVEVAIADRAGVLADVTTAVGGAGINIEDLWVDHNPSGGVLRILVDGREAAEKSSELLTSRGFHTTIVSEL